MPGSREHSGTLPDEQKLWAEVDATTNPVGYVSSGRRKTRFDPLNPKFDCRRGEQRCRMWGGQTTQDGHVLTTREALFGRSIGAGLVTPGDILAYRAASDQ